MTAVDAARAPAEALRAGDMPGALQALSLIHI